MTTPDPTTPALLSAARLDAARAAADAFDDAHAGSCEEQDAAYDAARFIGPLLRHLDAHGYARGVAAGLSEGKAPSIHADFAGGLSVCSRPGDTTKDVERITCPACLVKLYSVASDDADRMRQEVERLFAKLAAAEKLTAAAVDTSAADRERALNAERERDAMAVELTEARATAARAKAACDKTEGAMLLADREEDKRVAAARRDGAREEREAILLHLASVRETWANMNEGDALFVLAQIDNAIRARGEGQGPAIAREPAPTANGNRAIWPLLIAETSAGYYGGDTPEKRHLLADMATRHAYGVEHYGTPLQAHNGRDALVDAYQEALDLPVYLRQAEEEGVIPKYNGLVSNAVQLALWIRMRLDARETAGRGEGQGS